MSACAEFLSHFHIHNNDGSQDTHCAPGEGTISMAALLRQAQERRDRLRLFVYQQNPSALRLYQRHQFAITAAEIEPETGAWAYQMEWKRR